jgi:hypothetical protein
MKSPRFSSRLAAAVVRPRFVKSALLFAFALTAAAVTSSSALGVSAADLPRLLFAMAGGGAAAPAQQRAVTYS